MIFQSMSNEIFFWEKSKTNNVKLTSIVQNLITFGKQNYIDSGPIENQQIYILLTKNILAITLLQKLYKLYMREGSEFQIRLFPDPGPESVKKLKICFFFLRGWIPIVPGSGQSQTGLGTDFIFYSYFTKEDHFRIPARGLYAE